jgi:hypothetical protein
MEVRTGSRFAEDEFACLGNHLDALAALSRRSESETDFIVLLSKILDRAS